MKLRSNFVAPAQRAVGPMLITGWLLVLGFLALLLYLLLDGLALRAELPDLQRRAQHLSAQASQEAMAAASDEETRRTRERVARLNELVRSGSLPSATLLTELESLLPPQAWLTRYHYRSAMGDVRLTAVAVNAEPLSIFLSRLERSPLFEQAMLAREVQGSSGPRHVQFEIRLKVRRP